MLERFRFSWDEVPLISSDLPGTGGRIRVELADFVVTEQPAYFPSGEGEHLYLWLEKRGHTTKFVLEELSRQLGVRIRDIGAAGLKDRHAVTRQWLSLPRQAEARLKDFQFEGIEILETNLHTNKLGLGHLRANTFRIRVRDALPGAIERAEAVFARLKALGVPNAFGPQRFGRGGQNALRGLELVQSGKMRGPESIPLKRFLIGSLQSLLFNRYLALRIERGIFDALLRGDVAKKHDTGGLFVVEDAGLETPRAKRLEVSATGPLHGRKLMPTRDEAKALEDEVLAGFDLTREQFRDRKGSRRPSRMLVEEVKIELVEEQGVADLWLEFTLPKGSFATVVLREVMKVDVDAPSVDDSNTSEALEAEEGSAEDE